MRQLDVSRVVLEDERPRALEHAGAAAREAGRVASRGDALAARLDPNQPDVLVFQETVKDSHRVAAAPNAGDDDVGQASDLIEHLDTRLAADDGLEFAHHQRIRMRAER